MCEANGQTVDQLNDMNRQQTKREIPNFNEFKVFYFIDMREEMEGAQLTSFIYSNIKVRVIYGINYERN